MYLPVPTTPWKTSVCPLPAPSFNLLTFYILPVYPILSAQPSFRFFNLHHTGSVPIVFVLLQRRSQSVQLRLDSILLAMNVLSSRRLCSLIPHLTFPSNFTERE
jgi:hypothetical protein